jgi:predicted permease
MGFIDQLRRAVRLFAREPLYACGAAGTLALAVAAAITSFAVVKPALLDPLPYRDGDELVSILTDVTGARSAVSAYVLRDLEQSQPPLTGFASIRPLGATFAAADTTENVPGNVVTASYFALLGVQPAKGRAFTDGETDVVVVSWTFWQSTLGGDEDVLGRPVRLDGRHRTVIGVMPAGFFAPYWPQTAVWLPLDMEALLADPARGRRTLTILARRTASRAEVDAFLNVFSDRLRREHPTVHGGQAWVAPSLRAELVGPARPALLGTAAAATLLLAIVAANIGGLSAVRAVGVRRQAAVRAALGATRGRLLVERLIDSLAIAAVGSATGVWLASSAITILAGFQPQFLERITQIRLDPTLVALGLLLGLAVGVVAALAPQGVGGRGFAPLSESRGVAGARSATAMRSGLVIMQVALALVLIVGAGLLVQTVTHLATTSLGFESQGLSTFGVALSARYDTRERQLQFERDAVAELARVPGVSAVHASVGVPVIGGMGAALRKLGEPTDAPLSDIAYMSVAPGFLEGIGVRLVEGRMLEETDTATAPQVVVINETMARMHWPAGDAVGARVQIGTGAPNQPWMTVVGIVGDLRQHGPTLPIRPHAFGTTLQYSFPRRTFVLRTDAVHASLSADVRAAIRRVDSTLAIGAIQPFDQLVSDRTARHRLVMLALTSFGGVALVLSAFGVYAVVALTSQLRRREYAIRIALGAHRQSVRKLVLTQGLSLAAIGAVSGVVLAAAGTRGLQGLLHGVEPLDRATFVGAVVVTLALAGLSALLPALRAGRIDPAEALKVE